MGEAELVRAHGIAGFKASKCTEESRIGMATQYSWGQQLPQYVALDVRRTPQNASVAKAPKSTDLSHHMVLIAIEAFDSSMQ